MPILIQSATIIKSAGNKPKSIAEYVGRVNTGDTGVSVARMKSPEGWIEPGQTPEFQEITLVLEGMIHVEHKEGHMDVHAGEAIITNPGEWVRYSTPKAGGAEYVAICLPAFSMDTVNRDE